MNGLVKEVLKRSIIPMCAALIPMLIVAFFWLSAY